ncbi:MAG TPA: hypothetical protein VD997_10470 [Phycisphaerales bacterium]|nr:hypothetical protein [Phycisphaerales bacterium]
MKTQAPMQGHHRRRTPLLWLAAVGLACIAATQPEQPTAQPETPRPSPGDVGPANPAAAPQPAPATAPDAPEEQVPVTVDRVPEPTEAEVILLDGKRISGELVDQSLERIIISIAGIHTTFKMDTVDKVLILAPVQDRYQTYKGMIDPQDVENRLKLAKWVFGRGRYDLALLEVEHVLKLEPANPDAKELKNLVHAQQAVAAQKAAKREPGAKHPKAPEFPLLTKEQINLIRVFEVDLKDPPRMIIEQDTIRRFLDKYAGIVVEGKGPVPVNPAGRALFFRMSSAEVLSWMFDLKAREFYPEVQVLENPRAFQMFRDRINRHWLINRCATDQCHGGQDAGRLWLYNRQQASDAAAYTNFLILERFRLANGQPLINYNEPTRSPLLEYGLPRDLAVNKHPEVPPSRGNWQPVFRSVEDDRFTQAVEWMKSMYPKRPDYPIDYKAPAPTPKKPHGLGPDGKPVER